MYGIMTLGEPTGKRLKLVKISQELLFAIFSIDGTRLFRVEGMPADARCVGMMVDLERDLLVLRVESQEFPEVEDGGYIETLPVLISELMPVENALVFYGPPKR